MILKTLGEIAKLTKGVVIGDPDIQVSNISGIQEAKYGEMTWAEKDKLFEQALASPATAVLLPKDISNFKKPAVCVDNVRVAFALLLDVFNPPKQYPSEIHPTAYISPSAKIGEGSFIGPHCIIDEGVVIGKRVVLVAGVFVGMKTKIGENAFIHANATIRENVSVGKNVVIHSGTVIGSDGFGFVTVNGRHRKIPQVGAVVIQDEVEIGSNCSIDRATTGQTVIGKGTKIDNLVQVAHNVIIGEDCLIVAQAGIAGSTIVGNKVTLAGQAGVAGHLTIGENCIVAAKSAVMGNLPPGSFVSGRPARPHHDELKAKAMLRKLPDLLKRISSLEEKYKAIEKRESELDIE